MKKIREIGLEVASDLMAYPPHTWRHAYFNSRCKSWAIDNNFTKCMGD